MERHTDMTKENNKINKIPGKKYVLIFTMPVILLILLISATGAWFVLSRNARVDLFDGKISEWDLVVSDTPGGPPITDGQNIKLNYTDFTNVSKGVMAPGTYGTINLYIRTSTNVVTDYAVYIDRTGLKLDAYSGTSLTPEEIERQKEANSRMLQEHFRFYLDSDFTREVNMSEPITGTLAPGHEDKITIYWYWLYDGENNIPEDLADEEEIEAFLRQWDLYDCFISDHSDRLSGDIEIHVTATQQIPN